MAASRNDPTASSVSTDMDDRSALPEPGEDVLEEGDFIPEELFETVAALLAFVYRTRSK